jgi:hypothetical protein
VSNITEVCVFIFDFLNNSEAFSSIAKSKERVFSVSSYQESTSNKPALSCAELFKISTLADEFENPIFPAGPAHITFPS